jgi:hypothetical protein
MTGWSALSVQEVVFQTSLLLATCSFISAILWLSPSTELLMPVTAFLVWKFVFACYF